jgi:hypothetical protein
MVEEQINYNEQYFGDINSKMKDLEEKQRILRDRLLLVGQNLIETKEETNQKILEMKRNIEIIKQNMDRIISFVEIASGEFSKFAKKEDLAILSKQAKMFQPLKLMKEKI